MNNNVKRNINNNAAIIFARAVFGQDIRYYLIILKSILKPSQQIYRGTMCESLNIKLFKPYPVGTYKYFFSIIVFNLFRNNTNCTYFLFSELSDAMNQNFAPQKSVVDPDKRGFIMNPVTQAAKGKLM